MILAAGEEHMRKHKPLLPPFHGQQAARWSQQIADIATHELQALPVGRPIPLRPAMQRITFNVICRLVFGMEDHARIDEFNTSIRRLYIKDRTIGCVLSARIGVLRLSCPAAISAWSPTSNAAPQGWRRSLSSARDRCALGRARESRDGFPRSEVLRSAVVVLPRLRQRQQASSWIPTHSCPSTRA